MDKHWSVNKLQINTSYFAVLEKGRSYRWLKHYGGQNDHERVEKKLNLALNDESTRKENCKMPNQLSTGRTRGGEFASCRLVGVFISVSNIIPAKFKQLTGWHHTQSQ